MYAVIMAGGAGTRFWPLSRRLRPKQLLAIGTEHPLLVETITRLAPLVPPDRVRVVAGPHLEAGIRAVLPELGDGLIVEPCARNTAPCVGLAALHVARADPEGVMAVLPADHHIADGPAFRQALAAAAERARAGEIVTLGIRPTRPETGYGYIHADHTDTRVTSNGTEVCGVHRFVEKPPRAVAERYLADGGYLWNSGMFFFTARRILADIQRFLPSLAAALSRIDAAFGTPQAAQVLAEEFAGLRSVSLDYGVMEHAEGVRVIPADFGWNDVGHWAALADFAEADDHGNVVRGPAVVLDAQDCIVHAEGRLVSVVGARDLVVVATADAVLVCPRDRAQDVRKVVEALEERGEEDLL